MADDVEFEPRWRVRQRETQLVWAVAFTLEYVIVRQSGQSPSEAARAAVARADETVGALLDARIR